MGLACLSCGYDNDATRVYCHNCGLRLERKAMTVPPTGFTPATQINAARQRRPSLPWASYFLALVKLVLLGALLVAAGLALLPPKNVPAVLADDPGLVDRLNGLMENSADASGARAFSVPSADAGVWFQSMVKPSSSSEVSLLNLQRAYLVPREGEALIGLECVVPGGLKVYLEAVYAPESSARGTTLVAREYSIGRLPLPGVSGYLVQRQFDGLATALRGALQPLSQASQINVTPLNITMRWSNQNP
jgi:hypothetical protein